jgi:hypothetical protein
VQFVVIQNVVLGKFLVVLQEVGHRENADQHLALFRQGEPLRILVIQRPGLLFGDFDLLFHLLGIHPDVFHRKGIQQGVERPADFQGGDMGLAADQAAQLLDGDFLAEMLFEHGGGEAHRPDHVLQKGLVAGPLVLSLLIHEIRADGAHEIVFGGGDAHPGGLAQGGQALPGQAAQQRVGFRGRGGLPSQGQHARHGGAPVGGQEFGVRNRFAIQHAGGVLLPGVIGVRRPDHAPDDEGEDDHDQEDAPQQARLDQLMEFGNHHGHGWALFLNTMPTVLPPDHPGARHWRRRIKTPRPPASVNLPPGAGRDCQAERKRYSTPFGLAWENAGSGP